MIKLNDYLVNFPAPEGVTTTKISHEEFVAILEDGILFQWKLEFEKEGFDSRSSMLKEFFNVCICLEEAEMYKSLAKKKACVKKEHNNGGKGKHQDKSKLSHKRHHSLGKCHVGKCKNKFCDYH
eukprot:10557069-Ditylum_brightwellii.AAC.1